MLPQLISAPALDIDGGATDPLSCPARARRHAAEIGEVAG
jgi:hypothetical protein